MGRVSYKRALTFYDDTTRDVASFATRFNFAIRDFSGDPGIVRGDGMAFFLCSYPSAMPPSAWGGSLGLYHDGDTFSAKRFLAVEFDMFKNTWDPQQGVDHIGIDINSVGSSPNTTALPDFSLNGSMMASITFDGTTCMLLASLQFDDHPSLGPVQVSTRLTDEIMALLPSEVSMGLSAGTATHRELHQVMSWSFNSTLPRKENLKRVTRGAVLGVSVAVPVTLVLVMFILSWFRWRRRRDSFSSGTTGIRRFKYSELASATGGFSDDNALGEGAFGAVYKGSYTDENGNQEVAVKKIKQTRGEAGDFIAELKTISETRHMNLVELKGWCCSRNKWNLIDFMCWCRQQKVELFLVYELVPNGNLDDHLHNDTILSWEKRYQIVTGIGSALRYLQHECNNKSILHRDIKPGNILLDYDFNAKLADFGLSRIAGKNHTTLVTTAIGTVGYMDPQCIKHGDVEFNPEVMEDAAHCKLDGVFDKMQMERVIVLGLKCSHPDGKHRPYMKDAMKFLEDGIELPTITEIEA